MNKTSKEKLELVIGIILLFLGWTIILLTIIYETPHNIITSILSYIISLLGLILSTHSLTLLILAKKKT